MESHPSPTALSHSLPLILFLPLPHLSSCLLHLCLALLLPTAYCVQVRRAGLDYNGKRMLTESRKAVLTKQGSVAPGVSTVALSLDLAFSRQTFLLRIKLFTKVLLSIWTQLEAEALTWGLELRGKVGCFSWKCHSLGESAGRASSVSTEDVICYISEFLFV